MKTSVLVVMLASALAAATGFLREVVVAYLFGTSADADAFSVILVYIEGLYVVVSVGIASYMLVPLVVRLDTEAGRHPAERLLETLQLWTAVIFLPIAVAAFLVPDFAARTMAPGFNAVQHALLADMVPAGALCAALLVIGSLFGGVLQARGAFLGPVLGRGVFNLGLVAVLYGTARTAGTARAAALGLLAGGVLQLLLQVGALWRTGWRPTMPRFAHLHLSQAVTGGVPTVLGLFLVNVLALAVQRAIGSNLAEGSLAAINYAQRTLTVVSFLSLSIGTVSLTGLSTAVARDPAGAEARAAVTRHLAGIAWLIVPLSLWLAVEAPPVIALLFQRGAFTPDAIALTAECLRWFAASLVPGSLLMILHRAGSAWNRNWLVTWSSATLALATMGVTWFTLPLGATALPIALLCGNLAGLLAQAWLMRQILGPRVVLEALGATTRCGLRAVAAVAPILLFQGWFLDVSVPTVSLAFRLLLGLSLVAVAYTAIGLATADALTRELTQWGWHALRVAGGPAARYNRRA
jgi:putative peptidoglycan lipid II flippase